MHDGIDNHLELAIPLPVQQQQAQAVDAGEEDPVLVMRREQIGQRKLAFKIREINAARFLPLVPKRQRCAEPGESATAWRPAQ